MKKPYSFRLDKNLIEKIKIIAEKDNRKLTAMIENILTIFVKENNAKNDKK
jgi:predicted transcriptional regulator